MFWENITELAAWQELSLPGSNKLEGRIVLAWLIKLMGKSGPLRDACKLGLTEEQIVPVLLEYLSRGMITIEDQTAKTPSWVVSTTPAFQITVAEFQAKLLLLAEQALDQ